MTRRPKVWEPRAESVAEEMPEWDIKWFACDGLDWYEWHVTTRAPHAWDAWLQVPGAPAFGSCRVRRVGPT